MILDFIRRASSRRRLVTTLHDRIVAAARAPRLYELLGIPDTVEGRFESLCLHVHLVLRRLKQLPPPADDVAQDLVDAVFARLDVTLRELGVGDLAVAKRIRKLGSALYARAQNCDGPLAARDGDALAAALARNVLSTENPAAARGLADHVLASADLLAEQPLDALLESGPRFASAGNFAIEGIER